MIPIDINTRIFRKLEKTDRNVGKSVDSRGLLKRVLQLGAKNGVVDGISTRKFGQSCI